MSNISFSYVLEGEGAARYSNMWPQFQPTDVRQKVIVPTPKCPQLANECRKPVKLTIVVQPLGGAVLFQTHNSSMWPSGKVKFTGGNWCIMMYIVSLLE